MQCDALQCLPSQGVLKLYMFWHDCFLIEEISKWGWQDIIQVVSALPLTLANCVTGHTAALVPIGLAGLAYLFFAGTT
jgi:hypothetical protein